MTQEKEVFDAIVAMLEKHGFVKTKGGDMFRPETGCSFTLESLRKYETVVDFQIDYPYYA